jgi:hypothetical protein
MKLRSCKQGIAFGARGQWDTYTEHSGDVYLFESSSRT